MFVTAAVAAAWLAGAYGASLASASTPPAAVRVGDASSGPMCEEAPPPARVRHWPRLHRWTRGETVQAGPTFCPIDSKEQRRAAGRALFESYCTGCHGPEGQGDGPHALFLVPRPLDLTVGNFKYRSTPSGSLPTDGDLFRTISAGLHGTAMPSFGDLPEAQRWALVTYVLTLSEGAGLESPEAPLVVPAIPSDLDAPARVAKGARVHERLGCTTCHGKKLWGNGLAARGLVDADGRPVFVSDLTVEPLKRGRTAEGLYLTIASGLNGTPMPGYLESAPEGELWDVVAFMLERTSGGARPLSKRYKRATKAFVAAQYDYAKRVTLDACRCQTLERKTDLQRAYKKLLKKRGLR